MVNLRGGLRRSISQDDCTTPTPATATATGDATAVDGKKGSLDAGLELIYLMRGGGDVCRASIATLANPSRLVADSN